MRRVREGVGGGAVEELEGEVKDGDPFKRYILVRKDTRSIDFTGATYAELFAALAYGKANCSPGCHSYYVNAYEVVDLFEEHGRITYRMQNPPRMPEWQSGSYFPDDDNASLRFKAMELS